MKKLLLGLSLLFSSCVTVTVPMSSIEPQDVSTTNVYLESRQHKDGKFFVHKGKVYDGYKANN